MAAVKNLTIDQGSSKSLVVTYSQEGTPFNLTGYSARMWFKRDFTDGVSALQISTTSTAKGSIVLDHLNGKLTITIASAATDLLSGEYVYDLVIEKDAGPYRILQGLATISRKVTT